MKSILNITAVFLIAGFLLAGCTSNSTDITNILSPYRIPNEKNTKLIRISSQDSLGNTSISIPSGTKASIDIPGPAIITRFWIEIGDQDPSTLRQILVRMYWDKEELPSVEVPFSDFFGSGFGYTEYSSIYMGMTGGACYCYFPLPFEEAARIEIINESSVTLSNVSYQIDYQRVDTYLSRQVGYFHALWKRDVRTDYDSDFVMLKTQGRGHVVGLNLSIQSYNGKFDYLSGVEKVFVDGEKRPSILGTGIDDLFMTGSQALPGGVHPPFSGVVQKVDSLGRFSAFRFMVQDAISFKKSIIFSIEHGRGNQDITDFSGTVFWYQTEPHKPFPPIAKAVQRIPLRTVTAGQLFEAENLHIRLGNLKAHLENMSELGPEWSGSKEYVIETQKGSEFTITFNRLEEITYDIEVYYTKAPDFGNIGIYHGNNRVGEIRGYAPEKLPGGKVTLRNIPNPNYTVELRFVAEGKDSLASGYMTGLDGINLNPHREFVPEWKAVGPFQVRQKRGLTSKRISIDHVFPAEKDFDAIAPEKGMKPLVRQSVKPGPDGYVSLDKFTRPNEPVVNYVKTYIYSPEAKIMYFYVGSDDAIKVFLNGKQVYRYTGVRFASPDQGQVYLRIQKGWNTLMLKVANHTGNSGFYARILDRENILRFSTEQKLP